MIYTTYFAKISHLPHNVIPISICAKAPAWYKGIQFKSLAPKYGFFSQWKQTRDNDYYTRHYYDEVLHGYEPHNLIKLLESFRPDPSCHVALVCYEKPGDFCHRHLVAEWFRSNGIPCEEYDYDSVSRNTAPLCNSKENAGKGALSLEGITVRHNKCLQTAKELFPLLVQFKKDAAEFYKLMRQPNFECSEDEYDSLFEGFICGYEQHLVDSGLSSIISFLETFQQKQKIHTKKESAE